jgi:hypothetical protein
VGSLLESLFESFFEPLLERLEFLFAAQIDPDARAARGPAGSCFNL